MQPAARSADETCIESDPSGRAASRVRRQFFSHAARRRKKWRKKAVIFGERGTISGSLSTRVVSRRESTSKVIRTHI